MGEVGGEERTKGSKQRRCWTVFVVVCLVAATNGVIVGIPRGKILEGFIVFRQSNTTDSPLTVSSTQTGHRHPTQGEEGAVVANRIALESPRLLVVQRH